MDVAPDWDELGPWQRAAVTALALGLTVSQLPPQHRAGIETDADRDHADWLWLRLRRDPRVAMLALADERLREPPTTGARAARKTHPCPLCGRPASHQDRYPRAVCDDCTARTVDSTGRIVAGFDTTLSGGFEARFVPGDDGGAEGAAEGAVCDEVTASGRVWIDGVACSMGEARFGGVVVEALLEPDEPDEQD